MKRGMRIAADESERQQHDEAAQEQGSLHGTGTQLRRSSETSRISRIAQGHVKVKAALTASAGGGRPDGQ